MVRLAAGLFLVVLLAGGSSLFGQTVVGGIVGNATDSSGALLPGTAITVTSEGTGLTREAKTNNNGEFSVRNLLPGVYTVTARLTGFKTWVRTGAEVRLNQITTLDISMELGAITQSVEVTGTVPLLQTTDATVGHVVDQRRVQNLPLNGRDFTQLTLLVPGAVPASLPGASFVIGGRPVAVSGNRPDQNNYTLDGTNNNETFFKHYGLRPSVDAIQEFNIQTNISSARYGVGGAHVDIATRSGTNDFHGSVFEFLRNDKLDANDYFRNRSNIGRPAFRQNNFGATFGGPIWIPKLYKGTDKTFFFLNYEGTRRVRASTILAKVPTAAMLNGDLSVDQAGVPIPQIYDPFTTCGFGSNPACAVDAQGNPILTRQPFANNQIPASMIDPVSKVWTQMVYLTNPANRVATPGSPQNILNTTKQRLEATQFTVRGDHKLAASTTVFGRFSYSQIHLLEPFPLPNNPRDRTNAFRNLTISGTHLFDPTMVLEVRYGYSRDTIFFGSTYPPPGLQAFLDAGVAGIPPKYIDKYDFPVIFDIPGFDNLETRVFQNGPDRNHQFQLNILKIKGRNTINVGTEVKRTAFFHSRINAQFFFTSDPTANPQNRARTGYAFASYLLGLPSSSIRQIGNPVTADQLGTLYHYYLQDDIKLTSKLTLNLGLRYEWNQWFRSRTHSASTYDVSLDNGDLSNPLRGFVWTGYNPILGVGPNVRETITDPDFNNFAPRIGFAYRLGKRTTIRSSYGVFYGANTVWEDANNQLDWPYSLQQFPTGLNTIFPVSRYGNIYPSSFNLSAIPPTALAGSARRNRWPYIQQWNFHVQRELAKDLMLEVGYLGNRGTKLSRIDSSNDPVPGPGVVGCPDLGISCGSGPPHPRLHRNNGFYLPTTNDNNSFYHALQAKLERRFTGGLALLGAYTWSHNIDLASVWQGGSGAQDFHNRRAGYGNSNFDLRHNFIISSIYELPFGPGRRFLKVGGPAGKVIEGWGLTTIISLRSGLPFQIRSSGDPANTGSGGQFASLVPGEDPNSGPKTTAEWFNVKAFAKCNDKTVFGPTAPTFCFGNLGRNTMIGPGFKIFDLGLQKITRVTERHQIEFRVEFFNAFNNVNFSNPGATVVQYGTKAGGFGTIGSTANPNREIQFALKYMF